MTDLKGWVPSRKGFTTGTPLLVKRVDAGRAERLCRSSNFRKTLFSAPVPPVSSGFTCVAPLLNEMTRMNLHPSAGLVTL